MAARKPLIIASGQISQLAATDTLDAVVTGVPAAISAAGGAVSSGTLVFSNSNGLSFGINGQTMTAALPAICYFNGSHDPIQANAIQPNSGAVNLSFQRITVAHPISATRIDVLGHLTVAGSTAGSYTFSAGLYTFRASTASSASSASGAITFNSGTNLTAASIYGAHSGTRWRSLAIGTWNMTPGEYLIGLMLSVNGPAGTTGSVTLYGGSSVSIVGNVAGGDFNPYFADGVFSAATAAFPASVHLTAINQTGASALRQPYFRLAGTF